MTTAHRPTFHPAQGGTGKNEGDLSKLSKQYSSRDMPSHTKVKYRQTGQGSADEIKSKDFRKELEERERTVRGDKRGRDSVTASIAGSVSSSTSSKRPRLDQLASGANLDADDPVDEDEEVEESDDEDDEAELMAELARIKKEREAEKAKVEAAKKIEEEKIRTESILHGNPLLVGTASTKQDFKVKRRWDDDVVFKNCAKGLDDKKKDATFINDAIRSEFHKKFMEKYIK